MRKYTPEQRIAAFWSKVNRTDNPDECWEWTACRLPTGYGLLSWMGTTHRSNRIAWLITYGDIPDGLHVLHSCDNRACCNPNHLFLGTNLDNVHDRETKGRHHDCSGQNNSRAKFSQSQVDEIRQRYASQKTSLRLLGREYGVAFTTIGRIVNRTTWKK